MKCEGLFGRLFGHKMAARYSSKLPDDYTVGAERMSLHAAESLMREAKERRYIHDVCIRCGYTAPQPDPAPYLRSYQ